MSLRPHAIDFLAAASLLLAGVAAIVPLNSVSAARTPAVPQGEEIPPDIQAPVDEKLFLRLHATGDQIYTCKNESAMYHWTFKAPEAGLFDVADKPFGKHFAGPTWQASDGSSVVGKIVVSVASPDEEAIPWLLLHVERHSGKGVLSRATTIQRINTRGGVAPNTGCDDDHLNQDVRVAYSADYLFYAPK